MNLKSKIINLFNMSKKNKNKIDTTRFREKQFNEFIQCDNNSCLF